MILLQGRNCDMTEKLISVDIKAQLGFLKKPDINESIYLTYNMLHKPALLGILGAILGLDGYYDGEKLPDYYIKLKDIKVGIQPLNSEKGNYQKTVIKYNNAVGYANLDGGILNVLEQTLIRPSFRCFILCDTSNPNHEKIRDFLRNQKAFYLPYFGKNEYSLWWEQYQEYEYDIFNSDRDFKLITLFIKPDNVIVKKMLKIEAIYAFSDTSKESEFIYFEELPVGFDETLIQYSKETFVYTNFTLKKGFMPNNLYERRGYNDIIQLF
jgi:CRISPR-associated protein Cas5h